MGVLLMNKSGIFYPSDYGLMVGDTVELVLVGGGAHAVTSANSRTGNATDTFFGKYFRAHAGKGQLLGGSPGGASAYTNGNEYTEGGGAGGFFPGQDIQGGAGCSVGHQTSDAIPMRTAGGTSRRKIATNPVVYPVAIGTDGGNFGGGHGYLRSTGTGGSGGSGYGAGAGGQADNNNVFHGGASGEIVYATHVITQEDVDNGIPVTVGLGGMLEKPATLYAMPLGATNIVTIQYDRNILVETEIIPGLDYLRLDTLTATYNDHGRTEVFNQTYFRDDTYGAIVPICTRISQTDYPQLLGLWFCNLGKFFSLQQIVPTTVMYNQTARNKHYICNGYFVAAIDSSGNFISIPLSEIVAGNITNVKTHSLGTALSWGCVYDDLVVMLSTTSYKICQDWTPDFTDDDFATITTDAAIDNGAYTGNYGRVVARYPEKSESGGFVCTTGSWSSYNTGYSNSSTYTYVSNRLTGETTKLTASVNSLLDMGFGNIAVYTRVSSGGTPCLITSTNIVNIAAAYQHSALHIPVDPSPEPKNTSQYVFRTGSETWFAVCNLDGYLWALITTTNNSPAVPEFCIFGYAGNSGMDAATSSMAAGGAGGCCLISW